jgi:hypothetical protein
MATDYRYDVFVSYRRHGFWTDWVRGIFVPILEHWLAEDLGRPAAVFVDEDLEQGSDWPFALRNKLALSRVLVPLFSRLYFSSNWCRAELHHMMAREVQCGLRTMLRPNGLIFPAHIHDGTDLPREAQRIQALMLQDFSNPMMSRKSRRHEALSDCVRGWSPQIATAVATAPAYSDSWLELAVDELREPVRGQNPEAALSDSLPTPARSVTR